MNIFAMFVCLIRRLQFQMQVISRVIQNPGCVVQKCSFGKLRTASGDTEDDPSNVIKCGGYDGQNCEMKCVVCNNLELSFKNLCSKRQMLFERGERVTHEPFPPTSSQDSNGFKLAAFISDPQASHIKSSQKREVSFVLTFLWFSPAERVCSPSLTHFYATTSRH